MSAPAAPEEVATRALSCYTANLARYLLRDDPGALDAIARSVRLAVRTELPGDALAVSHHRVPLHGLPRDGVLEHASAGTADAALAGVADELWRHGQVLVAASSAALPWSIARPEDSAPHLLLVDGHGPDGWHVVDDFSALLPEGRQDPFDGWVTDSALLVAMAPVDSPRPEHRLRDEHLFGVPVPPPPADTYRWFTLGPGGGTGSGLPDGWRVGADAIRALGDFWSGLGEHPDRARFLDDVWAASQHHVFRYARLLHTRRPSDRDAEAFLAASAAWRDLPMALHFAVRSAARGRSRPAVVRTTFDHLLAVEAGARRPAERYGYPSTT
ncbi:hypothetical protein AB0G02_29870 [Actinosynnema sp. NPDC023658]|uniref:hypothetical protein n=1 Tax=Actinosynnema sp. NPDC023658 TaxID=3155465 RepID=UPI0033E0D227